MSFQVSPYHLFAVFWGLLVEEVVASPKQEGCIGQWQWQPQGFFFSHQKVAFVGVHLHASNLPAVESWAPIPLTSTCKLEMKAQTVGEAVPVPAPAPQSSASNSSILSGAGESLFQTPSAKKCSVQTDGKKILIVIICSNLMGTCPMHIVVNLIIEHKNKSSSCSSHHFSYCSF